MRSALLLPVLFLAACKQPPSAASHDAAPAPAPTAAAPAAPAPDLRPSVMRLNSTVQEWSPSQPWEKAGPATRRALAAVVAPSRVVTTAEMVANATNLEFESPDGTLFAPAEVIAVDYETNLALLAPAPGPEGERLFAATKPLSVATPARLGDALTIYQVEDNGVELRTAGVLQSVAVSSALMGGQEFLTYQVKASMQSAASSYTLPVLNNGALAGLLHSYNSKDQICDVSATEILARFLKAAAIKPFVGAPALGVSCATTEDPAFRRWLKLADDQGGLYLSTVRPGSAAATAGARKGDVLLSIDGHPIDRRGFFQHPVYGSLAWDHLIRGEKAVGETVKLSIIRDGKPQDLAVKLDREEEADKLVPDHLYGTAPDYLVKGGFIFQELTVPLLESFGENWETRAPLNLLDAYENPEKFAGKARRVVFLSAVIPTPATLGYESLRNLIVVEVNGKPVRDIRTLVEAFKSASGPLHAIRFDQDDFTVHLDEAASSGVDAELLQRGIPSLQRVEGKP